MGRAKKMATVTSEGSRLERLENLALILAKQIDICAKDNATALQAIQRNNQRN